MVRNLWTREEMILVLNLYLKLPFGQMYSRNSQVKHIAELIGRSSNAVAFRLVNFASLDPQLRQRGISGMSNGGKYCKEIWEEFAANREGLLFESERILAEREGTTVERKYESLIRIPTGMTGEEKLRQVKTRVNQNVFRQIVLANYNGKCALTGIDVPELLVASHIIPWAVNREERLNPENGICLSTLYDKCFDIGLLSLTKDFQVIYARQLKENVGKDFYDRFFQSFEYQTITLPVKYLPKQDFLEWHRDTIFEK